MVFKCLVLFALAVTPAVHCANILMLPVPHFSYVNVMCLAGKALQEVGHTVTVIVQESNKKAVEAKELQTLSYVLSKEGDLPTLMSRNRPDEVGFWPVVKRLWSIGTTVTNMCQDILDTEEIKSAMESERFDLVFINNIFLAGCLYALPYKYGLPYITFGPWAQPLAAGLTVLPTNEPLRMLFTGEELSFTSRLFAPITVFLIEYIIPWYLTPPASFQKLVPDREPTSFNYLVANSTMFLITLDTSCLEGPRLSAPNYVHIGSLSAGHSVQPLPKDILEFTESSNEGLIVATFGTSRMTKEQFLQRVRPVIKTLETVKENAIVQCDPHYLKDVEISPNIMLKKWLPQKDIFAHRNTKLFISHGGVNGLMEAIYHGVPVLTLPGQSEQARNGKQMEWKKFGRVIFNTSDSELIGKSLREIIADPIIKKNTKMCSAILQDIPDAKEQLVYWTNHVLKFGGSHLRLNSTDMPFYKFFMLDVLLVLLVSFGLMFCLSFKCLWKICHKCCMTTKEKAKCE